MKRAMLKKGLIGIITIVALVALFWFVVVDLVVEMVIESEGSKAVGAKVDVGKADLSLFPAGIEIVQLAVTDPNSPMTNAVDVTRIYSDIELRPLIQRKVIINNLRMEGIRLNTPRKTSGALPNAVPAASKPQSAYPPWLNQMCEGQGAMTFSVPNVKDILSAEKLESLQMANDLRSKIDSVKTQWQQKLDDLPTQKDLQAYQTRLNQLKSSGSGLSALMGSATELQSIQADLKRDLDKLKKARNGFQNEMGDLKKQSKQLAQAPIQEALRLKSKYALSPEGAANLSRSLFGPKVCDWWKKGYHWYAQLEPYLSSPGGKSPSKKTPKTEDKGADRQDSLPDFLIRKAHIDAALEIGSFTGQADNITTDYQILGKPLTFKFLGRQLKQVQSINMNGVLDFIQPDKPKHAVKLLVQQFALQNINLSKSENLPLSLAKAMADINMDLNLSGPKLDALVNAQLDSVQMAVEKAVTSELNTALAEVIENITRFGLTAIVEGRNPDYLTKIESDLDKVLQNAVGRIVRKTGQKLEAQLRTAIAEKTKGPIGEAQDQLGGLDALGGELAQRLNIGNNVLKNVKLPF